jgi:hypothetical protein
MSYNKLASTSSQRTNLIFTYFPNLTKEQDTQWFSLTQGFYNVSQPKRTLIKDLQPKVTSFDFPSFSLLKPSLKYELKRLYSALILLKLCHDSLRSTQSTQILSTKSCHDLASGATLHYARKIVSRFLQFQKSNFETHST